MHPSRADASLNRLCREYAALRDFNETRGHNPTALMAAEVLTGLVCLELFLRVILREQATETDTIANLLEKATSAGINLLDPPIQFAFLPSEPGDKRTTNDRNRAFSVDVVTSLAMHYFTATTNRRLRDERGGILVPGQFVSS